jgi:hypothetical protein
LHWGGVRHRLPHRRDAGSPGSITVVGPPCSRHSGELLLIAFGFASIGMAITSYMKAILRRWIGITL